MNGVIALWKPSGMTSHDCVVRLRRLLKTKKIGHTGTLDPEVEGVLPICIGKATKLVSLLQNEKKEYVAELSLGKQTSTEDRSGHVIISEKVSPSLTFTACQKAIQSFIGEIEQTPPMYSAIRVKGKRLYEYAREGLSVERPTRKVNIYSIDLLTTELNWVDEYDVRLKFRVECASGTYIRTLCVDIGEKLGYPAHMSFLERTKAGSFSKDDTFTFSEIEQAVKDNQLNWVIFSINDALKNIPILYVNNQDSIKFEHGQVLDVPKQFENEPLIKICSENGKLIALYEQHPTKIGKMKPFTVFN
ncbi:tRNA pseudouridine(55) synthase TruB [Bacillaceae bacterium W0354]